MSASQRGRSENQDEIVSWRDGSARKILSRRALAGPRAYSFLSRAEQFAASRVQKARPGEREGERDKAAAAVATMQPSEIA